ncbi:MAG: hypothetical protein HQL31_13625, partial [Planctomycetes bacterium]|nr:hypothetical protein [Planctomycetota bacterium]
LPHIWLGGDHVGLHFCGENDRGWTPNAEVPAQEVLRSEGSVTMRLNVISQPVEIGPEGRKFHFVILPTPSKPELKAWRGNLLAGGYNCFAIDTFGGMDMKGIPGDPQKGDEFLLEPRSWEHAALMSSRLYEKTGHSILYADASWPKPGPGFKEYKHTLFSGTNRASWTPLFEDYAVWAVNEFIRRGLIDGIYMDDVSIARTFSLQAGAYEFPGDKSGRRVGFTFMGQRRFLKRLWHLFEAQGKEPGISAHMTFCYEMPVLSFCNYLFNGEVFGSKPFNDYDAMDYWKPDTMRILGGAAKWGAGMAFKDYFEREGIPFDDRRDQWVYAQDRAQTGLTATSDVFGFSLMGGALSSSLKKAGVFGDKLKVFPWWLSDTVLELEAPEGAVVKAAVYAMQDRA